MGATAVTLPIGSRPPVFSETKFMAPRVRPTMVPRTELVEQLVVADPRSVTTVVGSPGMGKSSVLAQWYQHSNDGSIAWLSADRGDADPVRFWRGLIASIQTVEPHFGVEAADVITLDGAVTPDVLESLLADDHTELRRRVRLVIDDFHLVSLDAAQHLQHVLERGLSHLRLLIGSRSDPPVGLHRLRLQNDLFEIREAELRLSLDQTSQLVSQIGLDPTTIDVSQLHALTEGWAAGVQLAALSAMGSGDPAASVEALRGNNHTIGTYLTEEVLTHQPPRIRRFLEDTCVVDELDHTLCEALTTRSSTEFDGNVPTLAEVEAANLFLSRVDAAGTVFRYHHLFGELLRDQLRLRRPARFRQQHQVAADAYLQSANVGAALRHYWAAGERELAARVVEEHLASVYVGSPPPVDLDLDVNSREISSAIVELTGHVAALLLNGRPVEAKAMLDHIDAQAPAVGPVDWLHLQCLRLSTSHMMGDSTAATLGADRVADMIHVDKVPVDDWVSVHIPLAVRAYSWEGNFAGAARFLDMVRTDVNPLLDLVDVPAAIAFAHYEEGYVELAASEARTAHETAVSLGAAGGGVDVVARSILGSALVDMAEYDSASEHLTAMLVSSHAARAPNHVLASLGRARLMRAQGQYDAALRAIATARGRLLTSHPTTLSNRLDETEMAIRLVLRDFATVAELDSRMVPGWRRDLMRAWTEIAAGKPEAAAVIVDAIADEAVTPRQRLDLALSRLRIAVERKSADAEAHAAMAFGLGESTGAIARIAEAGVDALQHVVRVARQRKRTDYVDRLLATRPHARPADQATPMYGVDDLSAREVIILRYIATSLSYQEIAEALFLSLNTVKTHVKHVLRKLSASSRAEAVRRAQDLHYL